jgi:hypothetical protein
MALLSFADSAPRAYWLKAGKAYLTFSTRTGTSPSDHVRHVSHHKPLWLCDEVNRFNPESIAAASVTGP